MGVSITSYLTGEQLGRELAEQSEDCAEAILEVAQRVDLAELVDYLENLTPKREEYARQKLRELAEGLVRALDRRDAAPEDKT